MESGHRTAGHRHEEDREQRPQALILESCECRKVHRRVGEYKAQYRAGDHAGEHERGHIVTGLHHEPHGQHGRQEDIDERDINPHVFAQDHREIHTEYKSKHRAHQAEDHFFPSGQLYFMLHHAEYNGKQDEEEGNTSRRAVYRGIL